MNSSSSQTAAPTTARPWKAASGEDGRTQTLELLSEDARVSGDAHAPNLVTSGTRATGAASPPVAQGRRARTTTAPIATSVQHTTRATMAACIEDLDRAIDGSADFFARNNALEQMKAKLAALWKLRADREEAFAELINMIQSVFLKRRVEDLSEPQLLCLRTVLEKIHQESHFNDDFVNGITISLMKGGIDVFREIE
jgi:hypothetical protein